MKETLYYPSTIISNQQDSPDFQRIFGSTDPANYVGFILVYHSKEALKKDWPMCQNITEMVVTRNLSQ